MASFVGENLHEFLVLMAISENFLHKNVSPMEKSAIRSCWAWQHTECLKDVCRSGQVLASEKKVQDMRETCAQRLGLFGCMVGLLHTHTRLLYLPTALVPHIPPSPCCLDQGCSTVELLSMLSGLWAHEKLHGTLITEVQ